MYKNTITMFGDNFPKIEELHKTITDMTLIGNIQDYTELKKYENLICLDTYTTSNLGILTLRNVLNEMKNFQILQITLSDEAKFELYGSSNNIERLFVKASGYCVNAGKRIDLEKNNIDYSVSIDISMFKEWKKLQVLSIQFPKVKNLDFFKELNNIEHLQLYESCFENLDWIPEFENLETLNILQIKSEPILKEEVIKQIKDKLPHTKIISMYSTDEEKKDYAYYLFDEDYLQYI